jgi:hypothetical protein
MVTAQQSIFIEVDLLFVMARTATLNLEIPIGVPGLGVLVPMAGLYGRFLENPDWRTAACITMGYRPLTDH